MAMLATQRLPHCVVAASKGTAEGLLAPLASLPQVVVLPVAAEAQRLKPCSAVRPIVGKTSLFRAASGRAAVRPQLCFLVVEETSYDCDPPRLPAGRRTYRGE